MALGRGDYRIHEAGAPFRRFEAMRGDKAMAAAILNPPFAIHARRAGLKDMGAVVDTIGPYLGTVPYVLRPWAHANAETLAAYLAACIEGLRWMLDPANAAEAIKLDGRAPERAARHRGGNPRRCVRPGHAAWRRTPPSTWKASGPC